MRPASAAAVGKQLDIEADRIESAADDAEAGSEAVEPVRVPAREPLSRARRPKRALVAVAVAFVALVGGPLTGYFGNRPAGAGQVAGVFGTPSAGSSPVPPSSVVATPAPSPSASHRAKPSSAPPKRSPAAASTQAKASSSPSASVAPTSTLPAQLTIVRDRQLYSGQSWQTSTVKMTMQPNGDLVLVAQSSGKQLWHSDTAGAGYRAIMQADGNFVVYDRQVYGVWSTLTAGHDGAVLQFTSAGDVEVLYQDKMLWSTGASA